jgi:predicted amidohydrolase YtcJ
MLLTNGRIYTLDARGTVVDTLVVRGGRVAFAGRRADVNAAPGEDIIDLGGRAALPGLVDAHGHLMHLARVRLSLDLRGAESEEAAAWRVGERAARLPPGEWISGRNWDQNLWPGARFPSRATLDRVAPDHPVALVRIDGHATWANSAALRAAGIERATRDPDGGLIARDAGGEPTGLLVDSAQRLLQGVEPRPTDE